MSRYLDPKTDITFKRVFADPDGKERCVSLLNALLPLGPGREVVDIEHLPNELLPVIKTFKNTIADVRCRDNLGRQFIVEMQMEWTSDFMTRILLNASKAYISQFDLGKPYEPSGTVYSLNFINDIFDRKPGSEEAYYHHYAIYEREHPENRIEGIEFVLVELPKFKPGRDLAHTMRRLWLRFLTEIRGNTEMVPPDLVADRTLKAAVACLERSAYTREELLGYDKYWDVIRTANTLIAGKFKEGRAKGRAEGLMEGEAKGRAEKQAEHDAKTRETARTLKAAGVPVKIISAATGLSHGEIEGLDRSNVNQAAPTSV